MAPVDWDFGAQVGQCFGGDHRCTLSAICYLFLRFTLTDCLADYSFLAVFRAESVIVCAQTGLTRVQTEGLLRFRGIACLAYHLIMATLPPGCLVACWSLFLTSDLFITRPVLAVFYACLLSYWAYAICVGQCITTFQSYQL